MDDIVNDQVTKRALGIAKEKLAKVLADQNIDVETAFAEQPLPQQRSSLFQPVTGMSTAGNGVKHTAPATTQKIKLDPVQKKLAQEFGMTDDEYMQYGDLNTDVVSQLRRNG